MIVSALSRRLQFLACFASSVLLQGPFADQFLISNCWELFVFVIRKAERCGGPGVILVAQVAHSRWGLHLAFLHTLYSVRSHTSPPKESVTQSKPTKSVRQLAAPVRHEAMLHWVVFSDLHCSSATLGPSPPIPFPICCSLG